MDKTIALMAVLTVGLAAQAAVHSVSPGQSIQAAINTASDGDTIQVAAGTYDEVLVIQKSVHLVGNGATLTYTDSTAPRSYLIMLGWNTGGNLAQGASIEGFTLQGDVGLYDDKDLIKLRANGTAADPIVIRNNAFVGDGVTRYLGIETSYDAGHLTVQGNTFQDLAYGAWFNVLTNATISDNVIDSSGYSGLAMCTSDVGTLHDIAITGNTITDSGTCGDDHIWSVGMHLGSTMYNVCVTGNDITGNYAYGIAIHDRDSTDLSGVAINGNNIDSTTLGRGVFNETTTLLDATGNWWGHATGPLDTKALPNTPSYNNPGGLGDDVSPYVDYADWLSAPIPEPATMSLLALGGLSVLRRKRK